MIETTLLALLTLWCVLIIFYTLYLAAINIWSNRHELHWQVLFIVSPILLTMVLMDFTMNMTLFTLLMWDFPHEAFVTQRMKRYRKMSTDNWRKRFAVTLCTKLLNPFDPTRDHC